VLNFNVIKIASMQRDQAFVSVKTRLPGVPGTHNFSLKVDTGAQGNTMPYRTFRQMFPNKVDRFGNPRSELLKPTDHVLAAYNNTPIKCAGTVDLMCCFENSGWQNISFYVVDVPSYAILGLPSCESMHVVTLHCAVQKESPKVIERVTVLVP
jgi:hypothetical protein